MYLERNAISTVMANTTQKETAIITFIADYPGIQDSPIFVNFMNAQDKDIQFLTNSNDKALNRPFVDGSVLKRYTFTLVITRSITDTAIMKSLLTGEDNENLADLADIQDFMDWINEQGDNENYPDFGDSCIIEKMHTTSENPSMDGINTKVKPNLALYSMEIEIDYIDYSKVIWS